MQKLQKNPPNHPPTTPPIANKQKLSENIAMLTY